MVRLHALRLARCEHAQQHIARAGTGWQAHLSQPERRQAQCSRSCPRPRVLLAISHPLDDSAASSPTCNPSHSSVHRSLGYRAGFLHSPHCGGCRNPGLQPGLGRTDEREGSQDASEAKRVFFSDPTHLKPDPAQSRAMRPHLHPTLHNPRQDQNSAPREAEELTAPARQAPSGEGARRRGKRGPAATPQGST